MGGSLKLENPIEWFGTPTHTYTVKLYANAEMNIIAVIVFVRIRTDLSECDLPIRIRPLRDYSR